MTALFLTLLSFNTVILLNFKKLSKIVNIYDLPDQKLKMHKKKMPILGGCILVINYMIYLLYQIFFLDQFLFAQIQDFDNREVFSIFFLILTFFFLGLYDDKFKLSPNSKLFYSIILILTSLLLNRNLIIDMMSLSFYENKIFFQNFSIIFTIFCILILINSLNFYDGINGQSYIFFIYIFSFLYFKSMMNNFYLINIFLILFVLFINLRNKLFLGDSGVFLLSILASVSLIYEHNEQKNIIYADEIFFLLLLPGIELIRLTFIRLISGKNAFFGDRNHLHHLLIKKFSLLYTNLILIILFLIPLLLFTYSKLNSYVVFLLFLIIYISTILTLRSND